MAAAQDREVPYWASMRATEVNMRVGPSADYQIDWVYKRKGMPVKVIRLREGWRLIEDVDGAQGWVVARLLTPERGALVIGEGEAEMQSEPGGSGTIRWRLAPGVVGVLGKCQGQWCELDVQGHKGWVSAERLWGDGDP
ncbi:SH3 domain-containing protein [Altererythrobacter sp. MF3-039]|uniref:SH3 domain-containing protein n=1 Tax=Altererythrobacter sp. MF3-039 TaxID=3252901 RepID=UPI00390C6FE6